MQRMLRGDFMVRLEPQEGLCLAHRTRPSVREPIAWIDALILSLYDGEREESAVEAMSAVLCKQLSQDENRYRTAQERYGHLLLPLSSEALKRTGQTLTNIRDFPNIRSVSRKALRRAMPVSMMWLVTTRCSRRCRYCYLDGKLNRNAEDDALKLPQVERIAQDCFDSGVREITLSGGDPLMRKDVFEAMVLFSKWSIQVNVITKMRLDEDRLAKLAGQKLHFAFSLDSHRPAMADELSGYPGHHADMMHNFKLCKWLGVGFSISATITKKNAGEIPQMVQWMHEFEPDFIKINRYDAELFYQKDLFVSQPDFEEKIADCKKYCEEHGYRHVWFNEKEEKTLSCDVGRTKMVFDHSGKVIFCEKLSVPHSFGDLKHDRILDVWNSRDYLAMNVCPTRASFSDTECARCEEFDGCVEKTGCIVRSEMRYGQYFVPLSEVLQSCGHLEKE